MDCSILSFSEGCRQFKCSKRQHSTFQKLKEYDRHGALQKGRQQQSHTKCGPVANSQLTINVSQPSCKDSLISTFQIKLFVLLMGRLN